MAVKLGFIGAGTINRWHMKSAAALGVEIVAVAEPVAAMAQEVKSTYGIGRIYTDYRELVTDKNVSAVIVGTPNKFHAEHAIAALDAAKHVFLEKPMAMNLAEADAILAAVKRSGKILQMGMVNRFKGSVQVLKKFLATGRCGRIYTGQTFMYRRRGIPGFGGWFTQKDLAGGGALIDIGVHMIDLALYLMDFPKPVAVSGMTYNIWDSLERYTYTSMWSKPVPGGKKDVDDYALAIIRFDQGQTLEVNVSWSLNVEAMSPDNGLRLMGDKGGVALSGVENPRIITEEVGHLVDIHPEYANNDPFLAEMTNFIESIEGKAEPLATGEQGRMVQSILDAIYQSSAERREVRLD
jgi:predicted dehydrogenase